MTEEAFYAIEREAGLSLTGYGLDVPASKQIVRTYPGQRGSGP